MGSIGMPELVVVLVIAALFLLPVWAAIWMVRTVREFRNRQEAIEAKLDAITRSLPRN